MTSSAVLLDIEGTTTPIAFVHDVLFPYARVRLGAWLTAHRASPDAVEILEALAREHTDDRGRDATVPIWMNDDEAGRHTSALAYLGWLMDRDRKSPALKRLQGLVWDDGYRAGALRGELYPDVAPAFRRWHEAGKAIAIYSSGSELAQRCLFGTAPDGDLRPFIAHFFDTRVGAKADAASYTRIASALDRDPRSMLFVSDAVPELVRGAEAAGYHGRAQPSPRQRSRYRQSVAPADSELRRNSLAHNRRVIG